MSLIIHTKGLVKTYGRRTVVNKASVEVKQGEIVGLLGPNGAGKTTTFYMVVGLIKPDEGEVYLNDEIRECANFADPSNVGGWRRNNRCRGRRAGFRRRRGLRLRHRMRLSSRTRRCLLGGRLLSSRRRPASRLRRAVARVHSSVSLPWTKNLTPSSSGRGAG